MISSIATPATGEPRMTRGTSPHASAVDRPTDSSRRQISGTSSMRIQCSWMFWRSEMSAVSRANSVEMVAIGAQLLERQPATVGADAHHEVLVLELLGLERRGLAAVDPGLALRVQAPPAHATGEVLARDRGEALLAVDGLDALTHVETVVLLLQHLVGVERSAAVDGPLTLGLGRCGRDGRHGGPV